MSPESKWNQLWVYLLACNAQSWHTSSNTAFFSSTTTSSTVMEHFFKDGSQATTLPFVSLEKTFVGVRGPSHQNNKHQQTSQNMEVQSATDGHHQWHTMGTKSITLQLGFRFAKHDLDTKADRRQRHHNTTANTSN